MRRRIRCLWHNEATASLVQVKGGWKCYGVCQKLYTNEEVKERTGLHFEYEETDDEPEDLTERFRYIKSLPRREHRGLTFPTDERGYFICWPNDDFYKYRVQHPGIGSKYLGPKGRKPPLFWARRENRIALYITEGEINALSVAVALPGVDVCSPGSASMFNADNLSKYLTLFKGYSNVVVVLDEDAAGTKGLIEAKAFFLYKIPFISFMQLKPDANDILCESGKEALREKLQGKNTK